MENIDIKVGEYVRTTQGYIAKVERIEDEFLWFDSIIWWDYEGDYTLMMDKDESGRSLSDKIVSHSFNIIDLIEIGDYVNGVKVTNIYNDYNGKYVFGFSEDGFEGEISFHNEDIKSVVTNKIFKFSEYEVKQNDRR